MYEDENNLYHYSYRKGDEQNPNAPIDTKNYAEDPWDKNPGGSPKKKGGSGLSGKIVALALVCALVGGFIGAGVSGATTKVNKTSVQVSDREVAQVQTVKVDGKTQMSMSEVYASNVNSVVSINVSATTNYFGQTVQTAASGTGFFITEDGYILTNHHVISDASSVKVTLYNGETYDAKVIGSDEDYDIAVLKIDVTGATPVVLGDSSKVAIGESVAAVGNPLGELTFSMSEGIVSCVNRAINVDGTPFNMIQVDCSINPGNSGGPTFNAAGQVIGINSSIASTATSSDSAGSIGIGFAIPSNLVKRVADEIIKDGKVKHVALGVVIKSDTVEADGVTRGGATITKSSATGSAVVSGGPADKAGLKEGDTIVAFNGNAVNNNYSLLGYVRAAALGDKVTLTIVRDGKTMDVDVTLDQEESSVNGSSSSDSNGNSQNNQNNQNGNGQNGYGNGNGNSDGGTGDGGGFSDPFGLW